MRLLTLDSLKVGDEIPALTIPPLTRYTLALYFGASGRHNPIHVDIDFAKLSGLDEVIVQCMFRQDFLSGFSPTGYRSMLSGAGKIVSQQRIILTKV